MKYSNMNIRVYRLYSGCLPDYALLATKCFSANILTEKNSKNQEIFRNKMNLMEIEFLKRMIKQLTATGRQIKKIKINEKLCRWTA